MLSAPSTAVVFQYLDDHEDTGGRPFCRPSSTSGDHPWPGALTVVRLHPPDLGFHRIPRSSGEMAGHRAAWISELGDMSN